MDILNTWTDTKMDGHTDNLKQHAFNGWLPAKAQW